MQAVGESYYVLKDGQRQGPFSARELIERLHAGDFTPDDVCLRRGDSATMRLRDAITWLEPLPVYPLSVERAAPAPLGPVLADDAVEILYRGHPSALNYITSILISLGWLVAGIGMIFANPAVLFWAMGFGLLTLLRIGYARITNVFIVSRDRAELIQGLIAKSSKEVRIRDIRAINVIKRFPAGWLDVGNLEISSSASGEVEVLFKGVRAPHRIKKLIRQFQDQAG